MALRFQFSLRMVVVVVTVLCMLLGGYSAVLRRVRLRKNAIKHLKELGGEVDYDLGRSTYPIGVRSEAGQLLFSDRFAFYEIVRIRMVRIDSNYVHYDAITDNDLELLAAISEAKAFTIDSPGISGVSESSVRVLGKFRSLEVVKLLDMPIYSDHTVDVFRQLKKLRHIVVNGRTPQRIREQLEGLVGAKGYEESMHNVDVFVIEREEE